MGTQNVWVSKIVGTQNCGYLVYGSSKFCGGTQNFKIVCNKKVGIENLWVHVIEI